MYQARMTMTVQNSDINSISRALHFIQIKLLCEYQVETTASQLFTRKCFVIL